MKRKTAIEWLLNKIPVRYRNAMINTCSDEIAKAKEIEKKQLGSKNSQAVLEELILELELMGTKVGLVEVGSIIKTIKENYLDRSEEVILDEEEYTPYCRICEACGEEGCCSPLQCKHHKDGKYCGGYLRDLKFGYTLSNIFEEKIYDKMSDELKKEYDELWDEQFDRHYRNINKEEI